MRFKLMSVSHRINLAFNLSSPNSNMWGHLAQKSDNRSENQMSSEEYSGNAIPGVL